MAAELQAVFSRSRTLTACVVVTASTLVACLLWRRYTVVGGLQETAFATLLFSTFTSSKEDLRCEFGVVT